MAYQNNNNRITPKAQGKTQITPVTQIVNKELKYQPDLRDSQATQNLAQSLAAIGKGIVDFEQSGILQKKAQEQAIELAQGQIQENQLAWKDAQKKVNGLNVLNPYNKPAYQNLVTKDIYTKAVIELNSDPNFYKRKPEEIQKFIKEKEQALHSLLKENEIEIGVSGKYLEAFKTDCNKFFGEYTLKNNQYNYENLTKKVQSNFSKEMRVNWYNVPKEQQGEVLQGILNKALEENPTMPEEDLLELFEKALKTSIMSHTETLESDFIIDGAKNLSINGKKLADLSPELELDLRDTFKNAHIDRLRQQELEEQQKKKEQKKIYEAAEKEFNQLLMSNPEADLRDLAQEMCSKYDIPEYYDEMLSQLANTKKVEKGIEDLDIDEAFLNELTIQASSGKLNKSQLTYALREGKISNDDFRQLVNFNQSRVDDFTKMAQKVTTNAYKASFDESYKFFNNLSNKKALMGIKENGRDLYSTYCDAVNEINTMVQSGTLTHSQGATALKQLKEECEKRYFTQKEQSEGTPYQLLNETFVSSLRNPDYHNAWSAYNSYANMGMIPKAPFKYPNDKLTENNKFSVDTPRGTKVFLPKGMGGEVVAMGRAADTHELGNYILIKLDNGYYMRFDHLSAIRTSLKKGSKISANKRLAIGHTGTLDDGSEVWQPIIFNPDMKTIAGASKLLTAIKAKEQKK